MNKKLIYILIVSICISLLGMIVVQFFWIRNAFSVKEEMFNRSVNDALGSVVGKIETSENMYFISRNFEGDSILQIVKAFTKDTTRNLQRRFDSLMAMSEIPVAGKKNLSRYSVPIKRPRRDPASGMVRFSYHYNVVPPMTGVDSFSINLEQVYQEIPGDTSNDFTFKWDDQISMLDSMMEHDGDNEFLKQHVISSEIDPNLEPDIIFTSPGVNGARFFSYSAPQMIRQFPPQQTGKGRKQKSAALEDNVQKLENKAKKIQEVIKQMAIAIETKPEPIQQRINKTRLQFLLSKSLADKGIDLPYEFAVFSPSNKNTPFPIRSNGFQREHQSTEHRISLFPNDLFQKPDLLLVHFDGQKTLVFKSLSWLLVGSFLFTMIIVVSSGASIVVMIRQKKISDIKTDFINNMTHEFKTPIATISIAADSINNPRVLTEPETIRNFTRIIKEENNRMNTRVEQVLQMALLDSRDFNLRPAPVNLNNLIEKVVEHYRLQIEKREGSIFTNLEAQQAELLVDEDHIRNVLLNLLDNANKYSIVKPEIIVFSFNRAGKYFFGVHDRGIGMTPEAQRRVFDKFFRVTSGNIHNIKGFGLGLSYVKAIILAHRGEIRIESEIGKGSRFEIGLPMNGGKVESRK
ncbi:MAG: HAMP domain-containing sensor histidine kinase [Bacteroidetes bacterium]|nr:HAMP domain-containing sensor histidine kinase [Bacteroidota bacterium]